MAKANPDLTEEALLWNRGSAFVFGVDEAGRGCLAGPVCAAVACWAPHSPAWGYPAAVRDSKQMTAAQREAAFDPILGFTLTRGVGYATAAEIDRWNILKATWLAVARALETALTQLAEKGVEPSSCSFLTDGHLPMVSQARFFVSSPEYASTFPRLSRLYGQEFEERCVVKGDSKVFSIASASVIAKVSRDRHMECLDRQFPSYEFALHKGYSTPRHVQLLRERGPCPEHRRSFAPVTETLALFT